MSVWFLGNHSRCVYTHRYQCKEKRERGEDLHPRERRGPRGRRPATGARWVPAGIHSHPAGVWGSWVLLLHCASELWGKGEKLNPCALQISLLHLAGKQKAVKRGEASHCVCYRPADLCGPHCHLGRVVGFWKALVLTVAAPFVWRFLMRKRRVSQSQFIMLFNPVSFRLAVAPISASVVTKAHLVSRRWNATLGPHQGGL